MVDKVEGQGQELLASPNARNCKNMNRYMYARKLDPYTYSENENFQGNAHFVLQ